MKADNISKPVQEEIDAIFDTKMERLLVKETVRVTHYTCYRLLKFKLNRRLRSLQNKIK